MTNPDLESNYTDIVNYKGIWLPAREKEIPKWCELNKYIVDGKPAYQYNKLETALQTKYVKQFRTCIDVGAHVGTWAMHLCKRFKMVECFEPVELHRKCFKMNMQHLQNWTLHDHACSDRIVKGRMEKAGKVIANFQEGEQSEMLFPVTAYPLDDYNFQNVDFIKIDVEGYELKVIYGALQTIEKWKPCIIVEQKNYANYGYSGPFCGKILKRMGAKYRECLHGDYIYSWDLGVQ